MRVDMWSDIVCPFCWLGRKRLEAAAQAEGIELQLVWRSFELDPKRARVGEAGLVDHIAKKYGISREQSLGAQRQLAQSFAQYGGVYDFERARPSNTFDAHRLTHLAATHGLADAMQAALMRAYFAEGEAIGDHAVLRRLAEEAGLKSSDVEATLTSDAYGDDVRRDEEIATQQLDVQGVPFFVLEGRMGISGAQPVETFRAALRQMAAQIAG